MNHSTASLPFINFSEKDFNTAASQGLPRLSYISFHLLFYRSRVKEECKTFRSVMAFESKNGRRRKDKSTKKILNGKEEKKFKEEEDTKKN